MSGANETLADIVAEMRQLKRYATSESNDCRYVAFVCYQTFADRIEAAAKRETDIAYLNGQMDEIMNAATKLETWRGALWCKLSRLHNEMQEGERK